MYKSQNRFTPAGVFAGTLLAVPVILGVGLLVTLLGYSYRLLPSVSLDIGAGLLAGHVVFIGWSQLRHKPVTWVPFIGSLGAFVAFALAWGAIITVNNSLPVAEADPLMASMYEFAKTLIGYGVPVLLPLMGITRTMIELESNVIVHDILPPSQREM